MTRILIAEDEARISSFLEKGFRANGYATEVVTRGDYVADLLHSAPYDLLVLDVGLPGRDGFAVLDEIRSSGNSIPVIMLTARTSLEDTVTGLEGGADDYVPKPFRFDELLARVRLRLRMHAPATAPEPSDSTTVLESGDVRLELLTRTASVAGARVELSVREFALADEFIRHAGQVLTREQLLSRVWGMDYDPGSNVVDVYVRYLRTKLGSARISTVRGMGYRWQ